MKRNLKNIYYVLAMLICCFFISSCSINFDKFKDDSKETNVVIIAGIHSNSEIINMYSEDKIEKLFSNLGEIRVIVADGNPKTAIGSNKRYIGVFDEQYLKESQEIKRNNRDIWERDYLPEQVQSFIEECKKLEPDDSEVNTLGAIIEAVNILNGFSQEEGEVNKEIIIYDTGLCTSGGFSFRDSEWADLLFYDKELKDERIQPMVESLKSKKLIPNLSGIKLTWYGIGKTAEPQTELESNHLDNLKRIWWNILKAAEAVPPSGKGEYDYFFQMESQGKAEYPQKVTPIEKKKIGNSPQGEIQPTTIPVEKLGFKRESSKFVSEKKAMKVLSPYAERIKNGFDGNILLIGTTADPKRNGGSLKLSKKRAAKVKEYLVKLGVPANRIKIYGWGARSSLYDPGEWMGNNFKEKVAKKNRAVHLMPEESEYAQDLLRQKHP